MKRVLDANPDPAYSVHKLIGRAVSDLIILAHDTRDSALVCEVLIDDFGAKYLYMWGAYSNSKMDMAEVVATLEWAAKETGSSYIETISQRAGWGRIMNSIGARNITNTTYRKYI